MSAYSLAQAGARSMEVFKTVLAQVWAQLKKHKRSLLIGYGAVFLLASILLLFQTLAGVSANVTQAKGLAVPLVIDEFSQLALHLYITLLVIRVASFVLLPLAIALGLLLLFCPLLAIDIAGLYVASRQKGYREYVDVFFRFLTNKQSGFAWALLLCFIFIWFIPEKLLWPGGALGLSPSASLMLTLYTVGLVASLVLWFSLRRSLNHEEDEAARMRLARWLGNASGIKDFIDIALGTAAMVLMFGYLLLPAMEWSTGAMHRMVADYFVEHQDYERIVGNFPRERLLAKLDRKGMDGLKRFVLPPPEKIMTTFNREMPDFRPWRDRSIPHLIALVLLLTPVMLWIRRDLYQRAVRRSGP